MLQKYKKILEKDDLEPLYTPNNLCEVISLDKPLNLDKFNHAFDKVKDTKERTKHDHELSKLLHAAIIESDVPENELTDLRMWQWIALNPLREYSLWRWDIASDELNKKAIRFLGAGGVTGFSNHSASRLFFPVHILSQAPDAEQLIEHFWSNTQIELSIAQSVLSLNPKIFIAATRATKGISTSNITKVVNNSIVSLNLSSGSTLLDIMEEDELAAIMSTD
jgi:hypothetical protein